MEPLTAALKETLKISPRPNPAFCLNNTCDTAPPGVRRVPGFVASGLGLWV